MNKGLPWFRLYAEFAFDPKVQAVTELLQRRYIMLLCLKCHGDIPGLIDEHIACALRISDDELQITKKKFIEMGLITDNFDIPKWQERQYRSDFSNDRVSKFRGSKNVTTKSRYSNSDVTKMKRSPSVSVSVSVSKYVSILKEILEYLNSKTGKKYRISKDIESRIREGHTIDEFKKIIDTKLCDPFFIEKPHYLNPETLFRKSNFDKYLNQRPEDFINNGNVVPATIINPNDPNRFDDWDSLNPPELQMKKEPK